MASMLDSILGMVTPEMQQSMASRLGTSPATAQSALHGATAATLGGMAQQAGNRGFLDQIMQLTGRVNGPSMLGSLSAPGGPSGTEGDLIGRFLPLVFGNRQGEVAGQLAQRSGLSASAGTGLLSMAAPLVLGYLAKMHGAGSLNAETLGSTLRTEAPTLPGYQASGLLGTARVGDTVTHTRVMEPRAGTSRWAIPAAILGALILGWLIYRGAHHGAIVNETARNITPAVGTAVNTVRNTATTAWASLGTPVQLSLPNGTQIVAPSNGVEAKLVHYLQDTSAPAEYTWDFDRLLFDTGQATLQPASAEQLNNIAMILKAYPMAHIRLSGYTDNTGDPAANQKLSEERADNVMAELTGRGIDASRLSAQGYGEQDPVADNSTEEGRQKNRRISIRVAEK
jgi:OmpA-OmpF porin, OOP family